MRGGRGGEGTASPDRLEYSGSDESSGEDERLRYVDEVEQHGESLYREFLTQRMGTGRMAGERDWNHQEREHDSWDYHQPTYTQPGGDSLHTDLATMAERFSRSQGRELVRQRAEELDLSTLNSENFSALLSELFHDGGITQERILVLFFFCSDLTIRAVRSSLGSLGSRLTGWTLAFIRNTVAAWVRLQGGWRKVLRRDASFKETVVVVGVTVLLLAAIMFVRRRY